MHTAVFAELAPGSVELSVDRFGLTANNVTYGVMGDAMSYWKFFPTSEEGWGSVPVWGFGTITRSAADGLAVGERFYGYFPMSSHLVVEAKRISDVGFVDGAASRRGLPGVYNQYLRSSHDALYRKDTEPQQAVLRPLFATAYFLADFFEHNRFFGADDVLISSASSKLACATAFVMRANAKRSIIGLTSSRNADFVAGLSLYDRVIAYEDFPALGKDRGAVYIDIAGSADVRAAVHRHFAEKLAYSSAIGATHWDGLAPAAQLPGARPVAFFAPDWIKQRSVEWGPAVVQARLGESWKTYLASMGWLNVIEGEGPDAVAEAYDTVVNGRANPQDGYVLSLCER